MEKYNIRDFTVTFKGGYESMNEKYKKTYANFSNLFTSNRQEFASEDFDNWWDSIEDDYDWQQLSQTQVAKIVWEEALRRNSDKHLLRRYAEAILNNYPINWAFDGGNPEGMVANIVYYWKTYADELLKATTIKHEKEKSVMQERIDSLQKEVNLRRRAMDRHGIRIN